MLWTTFSTYDVSQTPFQFNFSGLDYMINISNGTALEFLIFKLSLVTDVFILTDEVIWTRADLQKNGKMGENLGRYLISLWNKASNVQGIVHYLWETEKMNNDCEDIDA